MWAELGERVYAEGKMMRGKYWGNAEEARENKNPAEPCGLRYEKREWCICLRIFQNVNLNGQALLFACPYHTIIIACHLRHDIPYIP